MCLHGSLEINIPVLLRGHSALEFIISAAGAFSPAAPFSVSHHLQTGSCPLQCVLGSTLTVLPFFQQGMATSNQITGTQMDHYGLWSTCSPTLWQSSSDSKAWVPWLYKGRWLLNHNHLWKQNLIHCGVNWFLRDSVMASFIFWAPGSHPTSLVLSGIHITTITLIATFCWQLYKQG